MAWKDIKWDDPSGKVSRYFTVNEAIYLPRWGRLATADDGLNDDVKQALFKFLNEVMDPVRELLGKPIKVHVCYRPKKYNEEVKGATESAHMARNDAKFGLIAAIDFSCDLSPGPIGQDCDAAKKILKPKLEELGARMEDNGQGASWVHLDNRAPGPSGRYFPA